MEEVYFESYGCTANHNCTEIMKGLVVQAGLNLTSNVENADFIVINSCIVKEPTEEKIRRRIQELLRKNKKIILAGCAPRINKEKLSKKNLYLLDTSHIKNITNLIQDIKNKTYNPDKYLTKRDEIKLCLPKISGEKLIGITQISEGCLGDCSYCITKLAKGKLFSYPKEKIIKSIKADIESGCKEIFITSQDCASYGSEQKICLLPQLLKKILELKGNFFVRLGMMNPNNVLKILPELIEIFKHPKMFKFIHIPVQSGSDKILKSMNRFYSKKDFLKIVNKFKKEFPDLHLSTDIIVGFPGETEKDFNETIKLIKKIKPETLNISKFWPRQNTPASKLKQIDSKVRSQRAWSLFKAHLEISKEIQKPFLDKELKVLIDKTGWKGTYLGRNENYKLFAVKSDKNLLGKYAKVKVKQVFPHYLVGETVD